MADKWRRVHKGVMQISRFEKEKQEKSADKWWRVNKGMTEIFRV